MFIRTSLTSGVKVFVSKKSANFSHQKQGMASKHNLGPRVFSRVKKCHTYNLKPYNIYDGDIRFVRPYAYFYETEFATAVGNSGTHNMSMMLKNKLSKIGIGTDDLHNNNVGLIRRRLVCVDFGKKSVS